MARTKFRDVGGGRRRGYARLLTSAFCLLLIPAMMVGCSLDNPTSPNTPADLTGQTTNQSFTFSGTIGVLSVSGTVVADDSSTVTIVATVKDSSGNPIPNLTSVNFRASAGGFVIGVASDGSNVASSSASATSFNGQAQVEFQSIARSTGTATITASIGTVAASTQVMMEAAPVEGTISLAFSAAGTGTTSATGPASIAVPLDQDISVTALDNSAAPAAIAGAKVRFRIVTDTTDEGTGAPPAEFIAGLDEGITNGSGIAATKLRVRGPGDVVLVADLVDPNSGQTVATSNTILLVTSGGSAVPTLTLAFDDGTSVASLGGTPPDPISIGVIATAKDAAGALLGGSTVRFTIKSDTTGGATLSGGGTTSTAITGGTGTATTAATLTTATQTVVIGAELLDSNGNVIAVANDIIANYD